MRNIIFVVKQDALFSDFSYKNMGIHGWGNSRWMEYVSTFEVLEGLLRSNKKKKSGILYKHITLFDFECVHFADIAET